MAAYKHNGNIYFYANGKWMDSLSRRVSQELESELNAAFPQLESGIIAHSKPIAKKSNNKVNSTMYGSKSVKRRKKATRKGYRRTVELTNDQKRALGVLESGKMYFYQVKQELVNHSCLMNISIEIETKILLYVLRQVSLQLMLVVLPYIEFLMFLSL